MSTSRLEAFSDGVIAIIITIMVLELKMPHDPSWTALRELAPVFMAYTLSFVTVGIYWNNHHHMLHITNGINGAILWANLHLLFWLSLIPFATGWMGEHPFAPVPTAVYGMDLVMCGIAYTMLQATIIAHQGEGSRLAAAVKRDVKGKASLLLYIAAIPLAFVSPVLSVVIFIAVALMWFLPDPRIERTLKAHE